MTREEFIVVCGVQRIVDALETNDVTLSIEPYTNEGVLKSFYVSCQHRGSTYLCGRVFWMEDLLLEDDFEEYFSNKVAYLIHKCERHMEG